MMRQFFPRAAGALRAVPKCSPRLATTWQSARLYSVKPEAASVAKPLGLDASKLTIEKTKNPGTLGNPAELVFGRKFTDHMLTIEWNQEQGWLDPKIVPYQNLSLDPATCVFHYAFECFEGMKAYKDKDGKVRLFRPDKNMARLNKSAARIALPTFEPTSLIDLISKFVQLDKHYIPDERGYSLYLRPTMIGTQKTLGAVSLEATDYAVRAWPGGVGDKKLGANYAPCIVPQLEAASRGHQQNLWLFGEEEYVTEVGTMNMFAAIKNKETGQKELVTAPLDGTILEGVTRDSVLSLARERLVPEGWMVSERKYTMKELDEAASEGRLIEAFGAGTAAIVSPIRTIAWKGKSINCGLSESEESGEIALRMKGWMEARQYGDEEHEWSYVAA
ncbi:Putative aminotransferase class IV, branched-chain amino acid aminotransferase II [Colletotrichum destructivum]|uniref:Branched-chain-amino-acid aminotransferase n=1 Tax=Colletotrichum destructivum TaxID=34406 RepID=A0AAX4ISN9_9PEZI|nr:Putative aminotransferase class IV, branched-chain amino acid aminotransferase II [Colletotrichum destructivum]